MEEHLCSCANLGGLESPMLIDDGCRRAGGARGGGGGMVRQSHYTSEQITQLFAWHEEVEEEEYKPS